MASDLMVPRRTLDDLRDELRAARAFDAGEVLAAKLGRINTWFRDEGLDTAVVGVSGGIDSAVVLGLLLRASEISASPLRDVVAVSIPIDGAGSTTQEQAADRARLVATALGADLWECPLATVHDQLIATIGAASGRTFDAWAAGQMLSVERTPVLYGAAALLQSTGARSVVVGTTNRDEGAYLGFFGKASDGMVDVQPLSDLHKSEVVALARLLGLPAEVVDAVPRGDVWDGRTDVEMIGATYDDVELVLRLRELERDPVEIAALLADGERLRDANEAVERLHRLNRHKYVSGGPSVHLDVLPRRVPDGWEDEPAGRLPEMAPPALPGAWTPPDIAFAEPALPFRRDLDGILVADDVLSPLDCERLASAVRGAPSQPVGVTGIADDRGVGSARSNVFSEAMADRLWQHLRAIAPSVRFLDDLDASEGHASERREGHRSWRLVGLSPLLRFMRYERGGRHLCHYDAAYEYPDGRRTLMSVVVFLTGDGSSERGGSLRFVEDGQSHLPVWERDHEDWSTDTDPEQVVEEVFPLAGRVAMFDHRRCHDVARWDGDESRIVIRGDLVYEPVLDGRRLG